MAKKPGTNPKGEFAFFNVVYEDGSQRSNRRVPAELLGGLDGDEPARGFIMEQDREIAEKRPPGARDQDSAGSARRRRIPDAWRRIALTTVSRACSCRKRMRSSRSSRGVRNVD